MKRATVASAIKSTVKETSSSMPNPDIVVAPDTLSKLKEYHATLMVVTTMIKAFHYSVVGMGFYTIHPKLGEFWEEIDDIIDETAELAVTLKGVPTLTMKEALELSCVEEHIFSGGIMCKEAMMKVETAFDCLTRLSKELATMFDEIKDVGSSGLIGDHYSYYIKSNWMIRAYLND